MVKKTPLTIQIGNEIFRYRIVTASSEVNVCDRESYKYYRLFESNMTSFVYIDKLDYNNFFNNKFLRKLTLN